MYLPAWRGEIPVVRFDLILENCLELKLWSGPPAEQPLVQGRLRVGVKAAAHGHIDLLGDPWRAGFGKMLDVELFAVLTPQGQRRVAQIRWLSH